MVIAIMGIVATGALRLTRSRSSEFEKFLVGLNSVAQNAYNYALMSGKTTQLFFEFDENAQDGSTPRRVSIRQDSGKKEGVDKKLVFTEVAADYGNDAFEWDTNYAIERFIVSDHDEASGGATLKTLWIYVMPNGLASRQPLLSAIKKLTCAPSCSSIRFMYNLR